MNRPVLTPGEGGGGKPRKPVPKPTPAPTPPPKPPTPPPPTHENPPEHRSTGQESKSESGKRNGSNRDESDNKTTRSEPPASQPSMSGFPQDIEWSPEFEARGIMPIMQAAVDGMRDSSEDRTTAVCAALYAANPEAVARGVTIMTGCEPDEEQDVLPAFISLARRVGLDECLPGAEPWQTTRLGPSESFAATATDEEPLSDLTPAAGESSADELREINILAQHYLSEAKSGWDQTWTDKENLENNVLLPNLERLIHGFDENSVNWDDFTLLESIDYYSRQIAGELMALSQNAAVSDDYYQQIHTELDWAAELRSLAEPKALDDTEVYAKSFAGRVHVPDAEHERRHVVDQITLIQEELNITVPDDYFESRSTRELKHDLAYLLQDDVLPFLEVDENEEDNRIGKFYRRYHLIARDTPENVLRLLLGSSRKPDVVGLLFVMGLSFASELADYALTAVDVVDALSKGDKKSAGLHLLFGGAPILKSGMVRGMKHLGRSPLGRLLPARIGSTLLTRDELRRLKFSDEAIDIFESRGGTGPGTGASIHGEWTGDRSKRGRDFRDEGPGEGIKKQNENAEILREQYKYNIVEQPDDDQLSKIGYIGRTDVEGSPILNKRRPDYIIEGRAFDHYAPVVEDPEKALLNIWSTVGKKVPWQTDRLVIDLSNTTLTADRLIDDLNEVDFSGQLSVYPGFKDLKEVLILNKGMYDGTWVNP